jgi:hypothetical protein
LKVLVIALHCDGSSTGNRDLRHLAAGNLCCPRNGK